MRRQVITAAVLGLALATTSLPALAGGGERVTSGGESGGVKQVVVDRNDEASCLLITKGACGIARLDASPMAVRGFGFDGADMNTADGCAFFFSAFLVTERVSS